MVMLYTEEEFRHRPYTKNVEYWGTDTASDPWAGTRYFGKVMEMKLFLLREGQMHPSSSINSSISSSAYREVN